MTKIIDILKKNQKLETISRTIAELSNSINIPAYLVGGCVRDLIIDPSNSSYDVDIMVEGDGIDFARKLAEKLGVKTIVPFENFKTAKIPYKKFEIEVASSRKEEYDQSSRKPKIILTRIEEDLIRRDFTVNAMAIALNENNFGSLIDPFNGLKDLKDQVLRTPLADPNQTFIDDPLRMIRAAYFAAKLQLQIDPKSIEAIKKNRDRIEIVSQERITNELFKILSTSKPSIGFIFLQEVGLLEIIFPEIDVMKGLDQNPEYHHKDIFYHTLDVVDNIVESTSKIDLRLAALVHDIGKPKTRRIHKQKGYTFHGHDDVGSRMLKEICKRMKISNKTCDYITKLTALHLRPIALAGKEVTDSAIRRLIVEAGNEIEDLMKLCRADVTTKNINNMVKYMNNFKHVEDRISEVIETDKLRNFQSPVSGEEIMKLFSLKPGKKVGKIKSMVEEAILNGDIKNSYSAGIEFLSQIKKNNNF